MGAFYRMGQALGWTPNGTPSVGNLSVNAAATWKALSFIPDNARTLSAIRTYVNAVTGTLAASDITCDLYDSTGSGAAPGASIETGKLPSATITAAGWYTFTGFTTALTAGQQYWLVFKNANGTPASNFPTFQAVNNPTPLYLIGSSVNRESWSSASSTNSGVSWIPTSAQTCLRLGYADGTYDGMVIQTSASSADLVYSARESGVKLTSPANVVLNVAGIAMYVNAKTGAPTGNIRFGLWTGSSPVNLAYTNSLPNGPSTTQWLYSYFSSVQKIQPSTILRATLAETTQSDTSSNAYKLQESTFDSDSNSLALMPFNGTAGKTYFDGSSWADTASGLFGFALLLDPNGEFGPVGGPPGMISPSRLECVGDF